MTNEELCTLIKGGDTGYLPTLWEQTRKFITVQAKRFYNKFDNHMGATVEDLVQSGYFAVLSAVDYYEPEKGLKYITFLSQTLKTAFAETMGVRTSKQDMLDYARSLDEPVNEQEDITLLDKIGDLTPGQGDISINVIESIFHQELRAALNEALSMLSEENRKRIEMHYYFNISFRELARERKVSQTSIETTMYNSLLRIYNSRYRKTLKTFIEYAFDENYYIGTGYTSWKHSGMSAQERQILGG
ncbi:MAG: sigma-70 family RNA polymerase sigma factor [Oscillospiraceae bacterium]